MGEGLIHKPGRDYEIHKAWNTLNAEPLVPAFACCSSERATRGQNVTTVDKVWTAGWSSLAAACSVGWYIWLAEQASSGPTLTARFGSPHK